MNHMKKVICHKEGCFYQKQRKRIPRETLTANISSWDRHWMDGPSCWVKHCLGKAWTIREEFVLWRSGYFYFISSVIMFCFCLFDCCVWKGIVMQQKLCDRRWTWEWKQTRLQQEARESNCVRGCHREGRSAWQGLQTVKIKLWRHT